MVEIYINLIEITNSEVFMTQFGCDSDYDVFLKFNFRKLKTKNLLFAEKNHFGDVIEIIKFSFNTILTKQINIYLTFVFAVSTLGGRYHQTGTR